ncbi:hypothetical protein NDU88_001533 [Pleurodeles waltl]|uniref:Uncharacterized protein n=1 Tax=Pleurodeles waltl TaxID=8319 RepID=A0AAV7MQ60_PLEWA|nr:hypothetical protein NDU88_001533 [Pleurodeles waltl]
MPGGRSSHKNSGKLARQLLFSEALLQTKGAPPTLAAQPSATHNDMADSGQESTMDRILQEISAVGRRLEGMDSAMVSLTAETKSTHMEIASFQTCVLGLAQRVFFPGQRPGTPLSSQQADGLGRQEPEGQSPLYRIS